MQNDKNELQKKTVGGVFWLFLERICAQLVSFGVSLVLARILLPDDYGLIAIVSVFINILNVFVTSSFSTSLVQKKDTDDLDYDSVLWFSVAFSVVLYVILFFVAPVAKQFYEYPLIVSVIRVMGLQVIIGGIKSVFSARLTKQMEFKKFFWATFSGTAISAVVSLIMAYNGMGVWALVMQYLINNTIDTVILAFVVKRRPRLRVSMARLKSLVTFGWKVLASSLIDTVYNNIRSLIIGAKYSSADLGFYNRGKQFPDLVVNNINVSINSAIFPALSNKQDSKADVKAMTRRTMKMTSYIIMPLMIGLAIIAKPLVLTALTEKWLPCVPYLQILCINGALMPLQSANVQAILAMGRSDINVKINSAKKAFGLVVVLITSQISVLAMAYGGIITGVFCLIVNTYPNKKLLGYGIKEQLQDVIPCVLLSIAMGAGIYWLNFINIQPLLQMALQIIIGAVLYIVLSVIFKADCFNILLNILKGLFKKTKLKGKNNG